MDVPRQVCKEIFLSEQFKRLLYCTSVSALGVELCRGPAGASGRREHGKEQNKLCEFWTPRVLWLWPEGGGSVAGSESRREGVRGDLKGNTAWGGNVTKKWNSSVLGAD